jgi:DNA-binding NarL/FixJ family response regulator
MSEIIHVIVADDHPLFQAGVVEELGKDAGIEIVGQAASGDEALKLAQDQMPDVVLLDIAMPGEGGISAASSISMACPSSKIIMLTVSEHEDDLMAAFKAGAKGYVLKGVSGRELANVIRSVVAGEVFVSQKLANRLIMEMSGHKPSDPFEELTPRELEILQLLAEGLSNRAIGERLHLAEKTVKHYMTNVLEKLEVGSRVQAALLAQKRKLMEEGTLKSGK